MFYFDVMVLTFQQGGAGVGGVALLLSRAGPMWGKLVF